MNINKIYDDRYYTFLEDNHNVAFYSLSIGLEEYFETYHQIGIYLSKYDKGDKTIINLNAEKDSGYIKCYLNIAIHIQHFFELETKRLLENEHVLFAVDDKDDPIILDKLLKKQELTANDAQKFKSVEFSESINRLKKLVDAHIIIDEVAIIFVNNIKVLNSLNMLRNTIMHRGKRIMHYCELDEYFSQVILPLINELFSCKYYKWHLRQFKIRGIYDAIGSIIKEGKKDKIDYSAIAYEKEKARCQLKMFEKNLKKAEASEEDITIIKARRLKTRIISGVYDEYIEGETCPCCENQTMFKGRDIVGFDYDELGDETDITGEFSIIQVPVFAEYVECGFCGFFCNDFVLEK